MTYKRLNPFAEFADKNHDAVVKEEEQKQKQVVESEKLLKQIEKERILKQFVGDRKLGIELGEDIRTSLANEDLNPQYEKDSRQMILDLHDCIGLKIHKVELDGCQRETWILVKNDAGYLITDVYNIERDDLGIYMLSHESQRRISTLEEATQI